jgi:hypothetical protein
VHHDGESLFPRLEALSLIRDDRELDKFAKLVAFMLVSHVNAAGICWPSVDTLAEETGLGRTAVNDALAALVARGPNAPFAVVRQRRGREDGARGRSSNLYLLKVHLMPPRVLKLDLTPPCEDKSEHLKPQRALFETAEPPYLSSPGGQEVLQEVQQEVLQPSKRSKSQPKTTDPRVKALWAHYHTEHERLRAVPPVFTAQQRGGVGKAWQSMLEVIPLDEARAVVTRALTDGYHVSPTAIVANLNRYRGKQPVRANGGRVPPQEGVVDPVAARNWGKRPKWSNGGAT